MHSEPRWNACTRVAHYPPSRGKYDSGGVQWPVLIFSFLGAIAEVVQVFRYVWAVARKQDRLDVGWPRNDRFPNLRIANLRGLESMTYHDPRRSCRLWTDDGNPEAIRRGGSNWDAKLVTSTESAFRFSSKWITSDFPVSGPDARVTS